MKTFTIASPYGSIYCYDYVVFLSLKQSLEKLGYKFDRNSNNRIYLMGYPMGRQYKDCGPFDTKKFNISLIGSYYDYIKHRGEVDCFDFTYCSSPQGYQYLLDKFNFKADGLWNLYSPFGNDILPQFQPNNNIEIKECDVAFCGNARVRPAVEELMVVLEKHPELKFYYYGFNIKNYRGTQKVKSHWIGDILSYYKYPEFAQKTKVVLLDMHDSMSDIGMPSFKYIDFLMNKAFVLVYKNKYAKDQLKGATFQHNDVLPGDLENKLMFYLNNPEERQKVIDRQYQLVKDVHSVKRTAALLKGIIDVYGK